MLINAASACLTWFILPLTPVSLAPGEDDGFLLSYVYDESTGGSELAVFCAKTMSDVPVARVTLPQRVSLAAIRKRYHWIEVCDLLPSPAV